MKWKAVIGAGLTVAGLTACATVAAAWLVVRMTVNSIDLIITMI
jgi:hypothetical protein